MQKQTLVHKSSTRLDTHADSRVQAEYKDKVYSDKIPKSITDSCDIKNVNSLTKDECNKYLTDEYKLVSVDPGKIRPLSMIDENGNFVNKAEMFRSWLMLTEVFFEIGLSTPSPDHEENE